MIASLPNNIGERTVRQALSVKSTNYLENIFEYWLPLQNSQSEITLQAHTIHFFFNPWIFINYLVQITLNRDFPFSALFPLVVKYIDMEPSL